MVSRRGALRLLAAGAAASAAACERDREALVPYVEVPEYETPGVALEFATALRCPYGFAHGVLATTETGRPIRIDGNPRHPASLGATDVFAQAALAELYDPRRSAAPLEGPAVQSLPAFLAAVERAVAAAGPDGEGLAVVTPPLASPSAARMLSALFARRPGARWYRHEPAGSSAERAAARAVFGRAVDTVYRLERARRIVTLDADLLNELPGHLAYARRFADARAAPSPDMPRLYALESHATPTGVRADHRLALPATRIGAFAFALAARLGIGAAGAYEASEREGAWLDALARDLDEHRGRCLVVPGPRQPDAVHALCHWLNRALGADGETLYRVPAREAEPAEPAGSLANLCAAIEAGHVTALLIVDRNPVYDAACGSELGELLARVPFSAHVGAYRDETARRCGWHVPLVHELERWDDLTAFDGARAVVQPVCMPLVTGLTPLDLYGVLVGGARAEALEIVRNTWRGEEAPRVDDDARWRETLVAGVVPDSAPAPMDVTPRGAPPEPPAPPPPGGAALELQLHPDAKLWDGRYATNAWLQELPDPLSTRSWGNAVELSPATAAAWGLATGDEVELEVRAGNAGAAVYVAPGHPDGALTLTLGYGRAELASRETRSSCNAFRLRGAETEWAVPIVALRRTGERAELVLRQPQQTMAGRAPVRRGTLAEWLDDPAFLRGENPRVSLYPEQPARGEYRWAMSIDLNRCIGCAACTIACQAENNIPVVGREQAALGRTMHWIRVDRYHDEASARVLVQPVPCMHCENAPCEYVCPVGATQHDAEGLNVMVYNRCIGTRDCSQNCPYKVRRFNWLDYNYADGEDFAPLRNPNVTVRSRGVMEKCTYCVQRISTARQTAEIENRRIRDGEVVTACQAVCPTQAIVFGDLDTPESAVNARRASPLDYSLLAELNTRPRTTYVARIDNADPALEEPP